MRAKINHFIEHYFFSIPSLGLHTIWFVTWFVAKLDVSLLTNIVSLEAIYLSIFIGLAQQHQSEKLKKHITGEKK